MDYAELIRALEQLPEDKRAAVLKLATSLAQQSESPKARSKTLAESSLGDLIRHPVRSAGFVPFDREEANRRTKESPHRPLR
jgi:hypothetical protein